MSALELQWHNALAERTALGQLRRLTPAGKGVDFCSNDYLGLAEDLGFQQAILDLAAGNTRCLTGATGSRLISGNSVITEQVEDFIATAHQVASALLFPSGYKANLALFSCIAGRHDTLLTDELVHRSVHDGCRLSRAGKWKFRHNDMDHLEELLKKVKGNAVIAVESLYSMEGDFAPLEAIAALAGQYGAGVVVDEAHAIGVFGRGLVAGAKLQQDILATVVTYGKAMGVQGAAILGSPVLKEYLVNFAAPFIYSTAMPDVQALSIRAAYEQLEQHRHRQQQLQERIRYFRAQQLPGWSQEGSPIQIVPFSDTGRLREVVKALDELHIRAYPVFAPTVKAGTERLRICLHTVNTHEEIDRLCALIKNMNSSKALFITGIGTGVGKTVVSATLVQHFQCAYWKPVQAGDLHQTDTMTVGSLVDAHLPLYPERYRFKTAASPHQAAAMEDIMIHPEDFRLPQTRGGLMVEGAGGLFVPLNGDYFMIDLVQRLGLPVVLVTRDYLGCINHTLLSLAALQYRQIPIAYLVFNGAFNPATQQVIERHIPQGTAVLELPEISRLDREGIRQACIAVTKQDN